MKKLPILALLLTATFAACNDDGEQSTWQEYEGWREQNNAWLEEMKARTNDDGTPYYTLEPWRICAHALLQRPR